MNKRRFLTGMIAVAMVVIVAGAITGAALIIDDDGSANDESSPEVLRSGPASGESSGTPDIVQSAPGATVPHLAGVSTGLTSTAALLPRGLSVTGGASATLPADQAFAVVLLSPRPTGPAPQFQLDPRDRAAILSALAGLGVGKERVNFDTDPRFGPFTSVSVEVPVGALLDEGKSIIDAIERVAGRAQATGARFGLKECNSAIGPVRRSAFEAAEVRARGMARAASVTPGQLISISEATPASPYGPAVEDPCGAASALAKTSPTGGLVPLDSSPEVKVNLNVSLTYAIGEGEAESRLTVSGGGSATARANEGYIVVLAQQFSGPCGPTAISSKDREEIVRKLTALGIDRDDIEIETPAFGGPTVVSVAVEPHKVETLGEKVVDAVEDVLGRAQNSGVYFSHTNCLAVLAEAQKQALVDARRRATALSAAAGLNLGALIAISESSAQSTPYSGLADPCSDDLSRVVIGSPYGDQLRPFDSEPEFEVEATLAVTFAMSP